MHATIQILLARLQDLELTPPVTYEEAKRQRNTLLKVHHPDKHAHDATLHAYATQKTQRIITAFEYITTYKDLLPLLANYTGPGPTWPPPPPPPPPPPNHKKTQPNPPRRMPSLGRYVTARVKIWVRRHAGGFSLSTAVIVALFVAFLVFAVRDSNRLYAESASFDLKLDSMKWKYEACDKQLTPFLQPKPEPPPEPFRSVLEDDFGRVMAGQSIASDLAALVGLSDTATTTAFRNAVARSVDIDDDGKTELLVTNIAGTCRWEGCPVFLARNRLRQSQASSTARTYYFEDLLPSNYGWKSVSLLRRKTAGAHDLAVTTEDTSLIYPGRASAHRECRRFIWNPRTERYVPVEQNPSPEECLEAEKSSWNIVAGYKDVGSQYPNVFTE